LDRFDDAAAQADASARASKRRRRTSGTFSTERQAAPHVLTVRNARCRLASAPEAINLLTSTDTACRRWSVCCTTGPAAPLSMTKGTQGRYNARRGGLVQLWHVEAAGGPERRGGERGQPDRRARATFDVESGAAPGDHAGGPGVRRVKEAVREFTVRVHGPQELRRPEVDERRRDRLRPEPSYDHTNAGYVNRYLERVKASTTRAFEMWALAGTRPAPRVSFRNRPRRGLTRTGPPQPRA
jgi:hypothetical protein